MLGFSFFKKRKIPKSYNISFENYSTIKVTKMIKKLNFTKISVKKEFDIRSYRLYSKNFGKGFRYKFKVEDAISDG